MHKHSLFCRAAALVLTLALTAALALPGAWENTPPEVFSFL